VSDRPAGKAAGSGGGGHAGSGAGGDAARGGHDVNERIRRLVRPQVQAMQAYHVPPPGHMIKLDAMENPYQWPPELLDRWLARLRDVPINRYPDPSASALKRLIRQHLGVPEGAGLLLGNGSDELIQLLGMALGEGADGASRSGNGAASDQAGRPVVLAPGPGFVMYRLIAGFTGMDYVEVPLDPVDFSLDRAVILEAVATHRPAIIYLAYPNNPTGNAFDRGLITEVIQRAPGVVVLDEAYHAFCGESFMHDIARHPHLLVMRTVSKMGLAGLRLGYMAGHPDWIQQLEKCRLPYNINVLTQASAEFALEHTPVLDDQTSRIRADRGLLHGALGRMGGVERVWPSEANFITYRVHPGRAAAVHASLREQGVLIKKLDGGHPLLHDCLRVTVGTPEENAAFLNAMAIATGT